MKTPKHIIGSAVHPPQTYPLTQLQSLLAYHYRMLYGDQNRTGEVDSSGITQAVSTLQASGHNARS